MCQSASEDPGKGRCWQCLRRAEAEWTGKQASLNGLANCVAGGVFRCQLSCDSQQLSPSNHACGVPSSAGMGGWDRGCRERTRQRKWRGWPQRPAAPGYARRKGSTETPGPCSTNSYCLKGVLHALHGSCLCCVFHFPFSCRHLKISVLRFAKQLDWGCSWHGLADVQKVWGVRS